MEDLRESMVPSWTVVIVLPSSGTLTFLRLDNDPLRCQNGTVSWGMAVSLREVGERPMDNAVSLSEVKAKLGISPTGLFEDGTGHNWYLEVPDCECNCRLTKENEGLFSKDASGERVSVSAWIFFSDLDRRSIW
jgi:hypothetical protein